MKNTTIGKFKELIEKINIFVIGYCSISVCYASEFLKHPEAHCGVAAAVYASFALMTFLRRSH